MPTARPQPPLTFSSASKLDAEALVNVFAEVENGLALLALVFLLALVRLKKERERGEREEREGRMSGNSANPGS